MHRKQPNQYTSKQTRSCTQMSVLSGDRTRELPLQLFIIITLTRLLTMYIREEQGLHSTTVQARYVNIKHEYAGEGLLAAHADTRRSHHRYHAS